MKKKILFVTDWPDKSENVKVLQDLLDKDYSEDYDWEVWSCKSKQDNRKMYRWYSYARGAFYILKNRKKYYAFFIWQQMVGYILFEILSVINLKIPNIVFYTFIYNSTTIFRNYKKHMVKNALKYSKGVIWASAEMSNEVQKDFKEFKHKNYSTVNPIMDVIDLNIPVDKELDDPHFRNGVYTAGKSERDFNIVIRAFRNTDVPVTIVCPDEYPITETDITQNIRILRFSQVNHEQYYALASQAFCILISVENEKSPCGQLLVNYAMENSLPIIATDCYGVKDYVVNDENGILFKIGQMDEIRKGYEKLKNDATFTKNIINNAKKTAEIMSRGIFIEKIISIIENGHPKSEEIEVNELNK